MRVLDKFGVEQWGWRRAGWSALMNALKPWLFLCRIVVLRIEDYPQSAELRGGLEMRKAGREDLMVAMQDQPGHFSLSFIDDALSRGDYCVGAFDGCRMVAWAWASLKQAPHGDGLCVEIEPPYSYGYKWFTTPEYRGQGIIGQLTILRDKLGAELGCSHNLGFIETHNYASWASSQRLGSRTVGYAGYFKLFGKAFPFRTPGVVKHTFRFARI